MSDEPTAGDDARTSKDAPTTEKRSGSADSWDPTEPVDLDHLVPLDMANNIDDERTKQRITWVDGFGRAYADALENAELEATDEETVMTDGGHPPAHTPSTTSPQDPDADRESSSTNGGVRRFPELPGFERDVLLTLARSQPTNGRGLLADLSTLRDEEVGESRLYPHLNELADSGLVEKRENYHDDRSHEYRLADAGGHALREHAQRLEGAVEALSEDQP